MNQAVAVAETEDRLPVAPSETAAILSMIERAARDPSVDMDKFERLMSMRERVMAQEAHRAFLSALAVVQPKLPIIDRNGRIVIREKNSERVIQSTAYAKWEDINEAITPVISAEGFTLGFDVGAATDGKLTVTGILGHSQGHERRTTVTLVHDSTGSKNAVQAVGSSISYGKRYAAGLLLNFTTRGEDDDGKAAAAPSTVTEEQAASLQGMIDDTHSDIALFCKFFKIDALVNLPVERYGEAVKRLEQKRGARK